MIQPRTMVHNNRVSSSESPLVNEEILEKLNCVYCVVVSDWPLNLFKRFLLLHFFT